MKQGIINFVQINHCLPHYLSLLVLLCWLSTCALAQNTTQNQTKPEKHHSFTKKLLDDFFVDYGNGNRDIMASTLCNFTQKLNECGTKASSDGHAGHGDEHAGHGDEAMLEKLVDGAHEGEDEHEVKDREVKITVRIYNSKIMTLFQNNSYARLPCIIYLYLIFIFWLIIFSWPLMFFRAIRLNTACCFLIYQYYVQFTVVR